MKKNPIPPDCHAADVLLAKHRVEGLCAEEAYWLDTHLQTCGVCRQRSASLANLAAAMHPMPAGLQPRPEILDNLRQRLRQQDTKTRTVPAVSLRGWMRRRIAIPLYQVVLGSVFLVLLSVLITRQTLRNTAEPVTRTVASSPRDSAAVADTLANHMNRTGRSISEDSLLTRFLVSAM